MKSALCAEAASLLRPDNAKPLFPFPPPSSSAFRRFIQLQCFNVNGSSSARSARATAQTVTCPWGNGRAQPFQSKHFCCNVADSQKESEAGDVLFHMVTCRSAGRLGRWQDRRGGRIRNIGRHSPRTGAFVVRWSGRTSVFPLKMCTRSCSRSGAQPHYLVQLAEPRQ